MGYEGGTFVNETSALVKEAERITPSALQGHRKWMDIYEAESESSPYTRLADALILYFSACRTRRNKFLLFINHALYSILLKQPKKMKSETQNKKSQR